MDSRPLLTDLARRPLQEVDLIWDSIDAADLNTHPAGHPNSIAWLLWHTRRQTSQRSSTNRGSRR